MKVARAPSISPAILDNSATASACIAANESERAVLQTAASWEEPQIVFGRAGDAGLLELCSGASGELAKIISNP